jgi:hypothetical protein
MGCGCIGPTKDKYSIENILNEKYEESKEITSIYPLTDYVKKVFFLINKIRTSPSEFVKAIEQAEKCIKEIDGRKVFDGNGIKVSLNEGKTMFKDCEEYLKTLSPMEELNFCDDIVLESPTEEKKIKDINIFKEKVLEKKDKFGISAYFKDSIRIPEISVLLMLVDDAIKNPRKKREALLNPKFKYIGISASDVNINQEEIGEKKKEENNINNNNNENNVNNDNNVNANNEINNNKNTELKDINKMIRSEMKQKPFCAYFTLK